MTTYSTPHLCVYYRLLGHFYRFKTNWHSWINSRGVRIYFVVVDFKTKIR